MNAKKKNLRTGVTLMELMVAMAIALIPLIAVGVLLVRNNRNWKDLCEYANNRINTDALVVMTKFTEIGSRSYGAQLINDEDIKFNLYLNADYSLEDPRTVPCYARFYLNENKLKVDYGSVAPVRTEVLAENVTTDDPTGAFELSDYRKGHECVRMNLRLTNPADHNSIEEMSNNGNSLKIMTAVQMRE